MLNSEFLKPIIKTYLNSKKKLEYDKVFNTYYHELLEIIKKEKKISNIKEFCKKAI